MSQDVVVPAVIVMAAVAFGGHYLLSENATFSSRGDVAALSSAMPGDDDRAEELRNLRNRLEEVEADAEKRRRQDAWDRETERIDAARRRRSDDERRLTREFDDERRRQDEIDRLRREHEQELSEQQRQHDTRVRMLEKQARDAEQEAREERRQAASPGAAPVYVVPRSSTSQQSSGRSAASGGRGPERQR